MNEDIPTKVCSKKDCALAGAPQTLDKFYKEKNGRLKAECKKCSIKTNKQYKFINAEKVSKKQKKYRETHKEESKQYCLDNKQEKAEYDKKYYLDHQEQRNKQQKQKKQEDPCFKLACYLRSRLYKALRGNLKTGSAVADLMMSVSDFKKYLEERWYPNPETGEMMSWENYGRPNGKLGWDIDHIIPLSAFDLTDPEQVKKACHYSNLRPMWAKQNISEGARGMSQNRNERRI